MSTREPVTLQSDWETTLLPWMRDIAAHLEVGGVDLDVDRVHLMTGVVADGVQRSMAPISAFLVGAAVARGAGLEEACAAVESLTRERAGRHRPGYPLPSGGQESPRRTRKSPDDTHVTSCDCVHRR